MLSWRAPEHQHTERGHDWYWALGIIAASTATTSILFNNFLFALLIVAAATTLGLVAHRRPEEVDFELGDRGLAIGEEFYPYSTMYSFWVGGGERPTLLIDTPHFMTPDLVIPIQDLEPDLVREVLLEQGVPEIPLRESFYYRLLEFLGF